MGIRVSSLPSSRRIWDGREGGRTKLRSTSHMTGSSTLGQPCPHLDYAHPEVQLQAQGRPQVWPAVPTPLARACPQPQEGSRSDGSLRRGQVEGPLTGWKWCWWPALCSAPQQGSGRGPCYPGVEPVPMNRCGPAVLLWLRAPQSSPAGVLPLPLISSKGLGRFLNLSGPYSSSVKWSQ